MKVTYSYKGIEIEYADSHLFECEIMELQVKLAMAIIRSIHLNDATIKSIKGGE